MKIFYGTLPAAAIAVIAGCQKPTDLVCEVSPEIFLTTEKVTAPADGGKCSIVYRIDDPSVDGKMTPAPSDDWMSGFIVSDTLITFEVEANNTESLRNGSIVLNYTWADKSVTAEVSVIQPAVGMEPAVELGSLDNIPSAGGSFEIPYGIINPVDGGTVSAASEAAWIENLTAADGVISFSVPANEETRERSAVVNVRYDSDAGTAEASVTVTQNAAGGDYDCEYDMKFFIGYFYDGYGMNGEYNYFTWICDTQFGADGGFQNGGTYYLFDMYAAAAPDDPANPLPPAGTYNIGEEYDTADMTFTPDYSQVYSSADNGQILMNNFLVDGTVTVSYEGSDIVFEAFVTDETGLTHHVTYTGQVNYILDM